MDFDCIEMAVVYDIYLVHSSSVVYILVNLLVKCVKIFLISI